MRRDCRPRKPCIRYDNRTMSEPTVLERPLPAASEGSTPIARLEALFAEQRNAFAREMNPAVDVRRGRLDRLQATVTRNQEAIIDAISADFGHRSRHETDLTDVFTVVSAIRHTRRHLRGWMK